MASSQGGKMTEENPVLLLATPASKMAATSP